MNFFYLLCLILCIAWQYDAKGMDTPKNESLYNMYRCDPLKDFFAAFRDQQTETIKNYFDLNMGYEKIIDLETYNSLAQDALFFHEIKPSFITLIINHVNTNHRNKLGETTLQTAKRLYLSGKLSKQRYDHIELLIQQKNNANTSD